MNAVPQLVNANGGTGLNKFEWAVSRLAEHGFNDVSVSHLLLFFGTLKVLALLDIWVFKLFGRFTMLCVAIMMGSVAYSHILMPDDLAPPVALCSFALLSIATWPSATVAKGKLE